MRVCICMYVCMYVGTKWGRASMGGGIFEPTLICNANPARIYIRQAKSR